MTLAAAAGLGYGRGIIVDDALRTADPAIWAVGECAEHRGVIHGLMAAIHDQARVAAAAIAGAPGAGVAPGADPVAARAGSARAVGAEVPSVEAGPAGAASAFLCTCRRLTREEIAGRVRAERLRSASEVMAACGAGRECAACKPGLAYLVELINQNRHEEELHARFVNDRVHANIQNDGTFSVVPRIRGGVTTPAELRRIADVAERHEVRMIKITGGQRIALLGVARDRLPDIWRELDMPSGFAYSKAVRTVKTCVGSEFCRFGIGDAMALGIEMESAMEGLRTPHKVKLAVSGCARNCAEASVKDNGIIVVEGGWQVLIGPPPGGAIGNHLDPGGA